jgi:hypothetical protein
VFCFIIIQKSYDSKDHATQSGGHKEETDGRVKWDAKAEAQNECFDNWQSVIGGQIAKGIETLTLFTHESCE